MVIINMKPPQSLVQGKPSYKLNSGKYKPSLGFDGAGETPAGTQLVNKLSNNKVKDEYIPSLQKQIGATDNPWEISLGCRSVGDLRKVYRGNGVYFNRQLLNADPIRPLSRMAFNAEDRVGTFGANFRQSVQVAPTTWGM
jgi:hypothetical protein